VVVGSVAADDATAGEIVHELRQEAGIRQAGELKFNHFAGRGRQRRLDILAAAIGPGGPLADRAGVYLIDKRYFIVGKVIDLLLEEYSHARGVDLYSGDQARQLARSLFNEGPRALGAEGFTKLMAVFVDFVRLRNRGQTTVTVEQFFRALDEAERRSTRRRVSALLTDLLRCEPEAQDLHRAMLDPSFVESLEPLIPATAMVIDQWSRQLGPVSVLMDEHKVLTDDRLDTTRWVVTDGLREFRHLFRGVQLRELVRGRSVEHPSIQLADLVAGAGRSVAHWHEGLSSSASAAGERLRQAVVPLIWLESMVPHDDPGRYAHRKV
jgi:hypothetical protein